MRLFKFFKKPKAKSTEEIFLRKELRKSIGLSFKTRKRIQEILDAENKTKGNI